MVRGDPESVEEVLLWIQQTTSISLFSQTALVVGHEVRALLPRYFAVFFDEVKDLAPDLAMVRPIAPKTGDKKLN